MKCATLYAACVAMLLTACQTTEQRMVSQGATPISGKEMETVFVGRTLYGEYPNRRSWIEYINPNGTSVIKESDKNYLRYSKWSIENDMLCFTYKDANAGRPRCYVNIKQGPVIHAINKVPNDTGEVGATIYRISAGNPENLQ